jgi:hypothetical protein
MMRNRLARWIFHHPRTVFVTLFLAGAFATALDRLLVALVNDYRTVVWARDANVEWPAFTDEYGRLLDLLGAMSYLAQGVLFIVLPAAALASVLGTRSHRDNATTATDGGQDDTLIAATAIQLVHEELENPLTWAVGDLHESKMMTHGIESLVVQMPDDSGELREDRVYLRSDICSYFDVLRGRLAEKLSIVRHFGATLASRSGDAWRRARSPFLDVLDQVLSRGAERIDDTGTSERWAWSDPAVGRVIADVRIQPEIYRRRSSGLPGATVFTDAPDSVTMIPLKEAITNAARAVSRRVSKEGHPLTSVTSIWVTVYITYDVIWVYVNDDGPGLQGQNHAQLAEIGVTHHPTGRGLGLYICEALSRLGICRYYLDDHPDGGAVARIMFYRDRTRGDAHE